MTKITKHPYLPLALLLLAVPPAQAFELDALLPDDLPGYGTPFGVTDFARLRRVDDSAGIRIGGLEIDPALTLGSGYDSAPNGSPTGSALLRETPSIALQDTELGLGAFAAGDFTQLPQNNAQNTSGGTVALGERLLLPRETITAGAAYAAAQETGFALSLLPSATPQAFTLADARADDKIGFGQFFLTPGIDIATFRFNQDAAQNRTDYRESLKTEYQPGGPGRLVLLLHATQQRYQSPYFNAGTNEILAGFEDDAAGLWTLRLLAGVARRDGQFAGGLTAPVLEAGLDWMPGDLDRVRLTVAREIDDPDQISVAPYTLTQARLSLVHEYLRNVILSAAATVANAAYLRSSLRETLAGTDAAVDWHLNAHLALNADYAFNDRQANYLSAANEHVVTFGMTWTP